MENDFLPTGYEMPTSTAKNYFKPSDKKTKIRMLSSPIVGFVDRDKSGDKPKPIRSRTKQPKLGKDEPKHFRAMVIRDYEAKAIKIWEITQASIREQLMTFIESERWNPMDYDLVVHKEWQSLDTKYFITTTPNGKREVEPEITQARLDTPVNLEALYEGGDPFEVKF